MLFKKKTTLLQTFSSKSLPSSCQTFTHLPLIIPILQAMTEKWDVSQASNNLEPFPRRKLPQTILGAAVGVAGALKHRSTEASGIRKLQKEGVQLVDREIQGMTLEAHHNPFIDDGTLRLHVCIEGEGTAHVSSQQLNEVAGTTPGYLIADHREPFDDSCFDINAVTNQAKGEVDEVQLGLNDEDGKHIYKFTRDDQGELSGEYNGQRIVDFSKIKPRDSATPEQ